MDDDEDRKWPPGSGCALGVLIAVPFWVVVGVVIWWTIWH